MKSKKYAKTFPLTRKTICTSFLQILRRKTALRDYSSFSSVTFYSVQKSIES